MNPLYNQQNNNRQNMGMSGNFNAFNNYNQYNPNKQSNNISTNLIKAQAKLLDAERDVGRAQLRDYITQTEKQKKRTTPIHD